MEEVKRLCDVCPHNKGKYNTCNDGQDCHEAANEIVPKLYKEIEELKAEIIKECKEHQEAMQVADVRIKELENKLAKYKQYAKVALEDFNEIQKENDKLAHQLSELKAVHND